MKHIPKFMFAILVILAVIILCNDANAEEWNKRDTTRELVWQGLAVIDWGQTLNISKSCSSGGGFYEQVNPILGDCPSRGEVNTYFVGAMALHAGISYILPTNAEFLGERINPREFWQSMTIMIQATNVARNYQLGININF